MIGKKDNLHSYIMLIPALVVLFFFTFYPVFWVLIASFKKISLIGIRDGALFEVPGTWRGEGNYLKIFRNKLFWISIGNTLRYGLFYMPITLFFSTFFALIMDIKIKGMTLFRLAVFTPYVISAVSASIVFLYIFRTDVGVANYLLKQIGVEGRNWLSDSGLAMFVVALVGIWLKTGYYSLFILAGLQNIPRSLHEAAAIDGAGPLRVFWAIILPSLRGVMLVVSVLMMRDVFFIFQEVYNITGGGPENSTVTMSLLIYNEAFGSNSTGFGTASAMSVVLFAIAAGLAFFRSALGRERS